jgi:RHS repeat-associated protein
VPGYLPNIEYNEQALLSHIARQNGSSDSRGYDNLLRLSGLLVQSSNATALDLDYERDRVGNIVKLKDNILSDKPSANSAYTYDAHYRLLQAHLDTANKFDETIATTFDAGDNILSKTSTLGVKSKEHMGAYKYQRAHLAVQAGDKKYSYDDAGNMLTANNQSYVWDSFGQMTQASVNNTLAQTLSYDGEGKRVVKRENNKTTLYLSDDCELRDDMFVTYVVLDGQRLVKITHVDLAGWNLPDLAPVQGNKIVGDGKITAGDAWIAYASSQGKIHVNDVPENADALVRQMLRAANNRALLKNIGNDDARVEHLHHNHLGTLAVITDARGEVTERFDHFPWGSPRFTSDNYLEDYSFTGQERDEVTGLSHHGVRLLNTSLPRWTSADPLFETLGEETMKRPWEAANALSYALNNPVNRSDLTGEAVVIPMGTRMSHPGDVGHTENAPYVIYSYRVYDYATPKEFMAAYKSGTVNWNAPVGKFETAFAARSPKQPNNGTILGKNAKWGEVSDSRNPDLKHHIRLTNINDKEKDIFTVEGTGVERENIRLHAGGPNASKGCSTSPTYRWSQKIEYEDFLREQMPSLNTRGERTFMAIPGSTDTGNGS